MSGKPVLVPITAKIPVDLRAALDERAAADDRSVSAVIRRALVEHLERAA